MKLLVRVSLPPYEMDVPVDVVSEDVGFPELLYEVYRSGSQAMLELEMPPPTARTEGTWDVTFPSGKHAKGLFLSTEAAWIYRDEERKWKYGSVEGGGENASDPEEEKNHEPAV